MANIQKKNLSPNKPTKPKVMKYSLTAFAILLMLCIGSVLVLSVFSTLNEEWPIVGSFVKSFSK